MRPVAIPFLLFLFISCLPEKKPVPIEDSQFLLDTLVRISVYDQKHLKKQIRRTIDQTFDLMRKLEGETSVHVDTSEVASIVQNAGRNPVNVSEETIWILKKSQKISEQTNGTFDITIGLIKELWGFDRVPFQIPDSGEIQKLLAHVNYQDVMIKDSTVMLRASPMRIDLGGIAKGYIIDRAVTFLKEKGMQSGIVEAGGDLRIWGNHPNRDKWKIGIKHPRKPNALIGVLNTTAISVATSGDYERFFMKDGKRYHHLLNPKTGYPASDCISVTIVSENALLADAYATSVFILGPEKGMQFIEGKPGIEGLILYEQNGNIQSNISQGIRDQIEMF
jgi:thiamine biosynthesis lipoprotein